MFISKSQKSQFYQLTYEVDGKRTTISTKTKNLQAARKFMNSFKGKPKEPTEQQIKSTLLSKFQKEYETYIESTKSRNYIRTVQYSFRMLINSTGDIQLSRLDIRTIDHFLALTYARTPSGAVLYFRTLKAAFSKAVHWNLLAQNPFKSIKSPRVAKRFPAFISDEEFQKIMICTREELLRDLFNTALHTGMRLSELVNMKWSWVDLQQNQIVVQCSEVFSTKSKKERIIPINYNLQSIFAGRFSKLADTSTDSYVFISTRGMRINEDYVSKKFKTSVRAAKLDEKIHFHSLRHSFASLLVQRGASLYVVKELLGHESLTTTQIYSHLQFQNLRDAVNLL